MDERKEHGRRMLTSALVCSSLHPLNIRTSAEMAWAAFEAYSMRFVWSGLAIEGLPPAAIRAWCEFKKVSEPNHPREWGSARDDGRIDRLARFPVAFCAPRIDAKCIGPGTEGI